MKKTRKIHIFSPIGKKCAYFFPNWLKIYTIATIKGWKPLIIINFHSGQKYKSRRGGGKNMIFKFNIHPCLLVFWAGVDNPLQFLLQNQALTSLIFFKGLAVDFQDITILQYYALTTLIFFKGLVVEFQDITVLQYIICITPLKKYNILPFFF